MYGLYTGRWTVAVDRIEYADKCVVMKSASTANARTACYPSDKLRQLESGYFTWIPLGHQAQFRHLYPTNPTMY